MSLGKIYSYPNNPRVAKALIAAKYNDQTVEVAPVNIGVDNKSPEFLKKFPLGKLPAFESADGYCLYESSAIAYYVASAKEGTALLGKDKKELGKIHQFIALADNEFSPIAAAWLYPIFGYGEGSDAVTAKAKTDALRTLAVLDAHLLHNTFLVGNSVSLADITMVSVLIGFYKAVFEPEYRKNFKNVTRWFLTCINQTQFKTVLGDVVLCEKMQVAVKKAAVAAAAPVAAKKAEKPASPPKASEKKPKKKAADDDEDDEPSYADEKPKEKNPLDLLPKSTFSMDAWKRCYSNNPTRPTAIDYFWKEFDAAGFSIWRCDYKYNSELTMTFMSSNLVGGFFQRLESARKYAFGSLCIMGEDNKSVIAGYFVFRGLEVPFEVKDSADYDSYKFTKADHTNAKDRELFNAYIAWDESIEGRKFADGKVFK